MVYFTCNHCGESLKKASVEKHYGRCRHPKFLTCVDCMKDFRGEEYNGHTKCVTEAEKYSAKGFSSRSPSVKGETKQLSWLELIQYVCQNYFNIPEEQTRLLQVLCDHSNVPQKKSKFHNFVRNVSKHSRRAVVDEVWDLLEAEKNARKEKEAKSTDEKSIEDNGKQNGKAQTVRSEGVNGKHNNPQLPSSDKDKQSGDNSEEKDCDSTKKKKNKKKKKRDKANPDNNDNGTTEMEPEVSSAKPSKSKKKRKIEEDLASCDDASVLKKKKHNGENKESVPKKTKTDKFNWCNIIVEVLESADNNELSVKRLRKKVLSEFASTGAEVDESVYAKFTKKLSKIPVVLLLKDKAKLKREN